MLILVYYYIYTVMLSVSVVETSGRNAPREPSPVGEGGPLAVDEDNFNNSPSLFEKPCLCTQHKTQITIYNPLADKQRKYAAEGKIRREGIFHAFFLFTRGCNA